MNSERFTTLAQAYGADLSRWPAEERDAAVEFLAANPGALEEEAALDALLDLAPAASLSPDLASRLAYGAPRGRPQRLGRPQAWMSGAGLAAACVLGLAFGASLPAHILVDPSTEALVETQTAFDTGADLTGLEEMG